MTGVGGFVAVHMAGIDEAIGRLVGLQIADGAAGQVGTQAQAVAAAALLVAFNPIGVHALAGRMIGREVQLVKAVQLAGNIVFLKDLKAHGAERVVQIIAHLGNGVQAAAEGTDARHGNIKVGGHLGGFHFQFVAALVDQGGQLALDLIDSLAHFRTHRHIQLGQFLEHFRQGTLLTQQEGFDILQLGLILRGLDFLLALKEQSI